jgi:hypothetical protein
LNETADIVTQDFAQQLIHLRLIRLAAKRAAKLALNHAERGFDVAAVVMVF